MFRVFKWIGRQPVNAVKFVSRQAGSKTGRAMLTTMVMTTGAIVGGEDFTRYAPALIEPSLDLVADPAVGNLVNLAALAVMFARDRQLKDTR